MSNEFLKDDENNIDDVNTRHPKIYAFLSKLVDRNALEHGEITTANTENSHIIIIRIRAIGLNIIKAALEANDIEFGSNQNSGSPIFGSFNGIRWEVKGDNDRNNTEFWRFDLPNENKG